jgi:hypothetical protein
MSARTGQFQFGPRGVLSTEASAETATNYVHCAKNVGSRSAENLSGFVPVG